jgi:hypothetical protein
MERGEKGIHLLVWGIGIILFGSLVNSITIVSWTIYMPTWFVVGFGFFPLIGGIWLLAKRKA